jgi:hypothetical protein
MKGFMFSIEALMAVSIVIMATTMIWYSTTLVEQETNNIYLEQQSQKILTIYFNLPSQQSNPNNYLQYCGESIQYSSETKEFFEKTICVGVTK